MNPNFNSKFITVGVINSNFTSGVGVHSLYKLYNTFFNAKFLHGPPNNFYCDLIKCLFKVNQWGVQFPVLSQMFFL